MCGIFGCTWAPGSHLTERDVRRVLQVCFECSETRGKEAAGLALLYDTHLAIRKDASRGRAFIRGSIYNELLTSVLSNTSWNSSTFGFIGHTRLVTNGAMEKPENNQPVVRDGIVGVHNGIIVNDDEIFDRYQASRDAEVDTEALLAGIGVLLSQGRELPQAIREAFKHIKGSASVALFFQDFPILFLGTNTGSLYISQHADGFIFASEHLILQSILLRLKKIILPTGDIEHIQSMKGYILSLETGSRIPYSLLHDDVHHVVHRKQSPYRIDTTQPSQRPFSPPQKNWSPAETERILELFHGRQDLVNRLRRCRRCILPETMPFIAFDDDGVCQYCRNHTKYIPRGIDALQQSIAPFRKVDGTPDCIFPLSGGRDSSYGLHIVKEVLGLHPVAYSYDWGMLTDLGRRNQARMCGSLGVEHILLSADILQKRNFIRKNVLAWLEKPDLGTIPLFMAGDKQYFSYLNRLQDSMKIKLSVYCENPLERTNFKYGFCGVPPSFGHDHVYKIGAFNKLRLAFYYFRQYVQNPRLFNSSIFDTLSAYISTYVVSHDYLYLYHYIQWDEEEINKTLQTVYDWELSPDTPTTWRIGDGTAAFYNYIYYVVAGLTENDTFRSHQIREGIMTRETALALVRAENQPRIPSLQWYGHTININMFDAIQRIHTMPHLLGSV